MKKANKCHSRWEGSEMATQLLNLPVNIPWKLIGVRQDMMHIHFSNIRQ